MPYPPLPVAQITYDSESTESGSVPAEFEADLFKPITPGQLKLIIYLRVNLRQMNPRWFPYIKDADGRVFSTSFWTSFDWGRFTGAAKTQADLWNNKFWLLPPRSFTDYDLVSSDFPNQMFRPNIRCELAVDFNPQGSAHRTIDVANLDLSKLSGQPLGPGTFRSHAFLYDSLDAIPWIAPYGTGPGLPSVQPVIAHEIGHAIGLDHIGVMRRTPLCDFAMKYEDSLENSNFAGGTNSLYCYGFNQGIVQSGNIMGAGNGFAIENGRPWVWAINSMRKGHPYESAQWRIAMSDPGPGTWIRR